MACTLKLIAFTAVLLTLGSAQFGGICRIYYDYDYEGHGVLDEHGGG